MSRSSSRKRPSRCADCMGPPHRRCPLYLGPLARSIFVQGAAAAAIPRVCTQTSITHQTPGGCACGRVRDSLSNLRLPRRESRGALLHGALESATDPHHRHAPPPHTTRARAGPVLHALASAAQAVPRLPCEPRRGGDPRGAEALHGGHHNAPEDLQPRRPRATQRARRRPRRGVRGARAWREAGRDDAGVATLSCMHGAVPLRPCSCDRCRRGALPCH
jgi:hypothetical protein